MMTFAILVRPDAQIDCNNKCKINECNLYPDDNDNRQHDWGEFFDFKTKTKSPANRPNPPAGLPLL